MSSAEPEPHTIVVRQSRSCDGLNVTVELLTFGPDTTDRNRQPQQQRPCTHGDSIHRETQPKERTTSQVKHSLCMNVCTIL